MESARIISKYESIRGKEKILLECGVLKDGRSAKNNQDDFELMDVKPRPLSDLEFSEGKTDRGKIERHIQELENMLMMEAGVLGQKEQIAIPLENSLSHIHLQGIQIDESMTNDSNLIKSESQLVKNESRTQDK